jgi:Tol biopolymer transport system component
MISLRMPTAALAPIALLLLACSPESDQVVFEMQAQSFANSEWSSPENLAAINSTFNEQAPTLSPDGLSLYFGSNRPREGGSTDTDLWVSHRSCRDCRWGTPENLGPLVNSSVGDNGPSLSSDGHLLYFTSARPGVGLNDIYVSRRANRKDDFGWGPPVLLGPGVNTAAFEAGAEPVAGDDDEDDDRDQDGDDDGAANFYFNRGPTQTAQDIYIASIKRNGETRGPAVLVAELSDATANDAAASVRGDGREIFFGSTRMSGAGGLDIWTSTRRSVHDPWSPPMNLVGVNSAANDQQSSLSSDGRTLLFASDRSGSIGGTDIWMSARRPLEN